jgi:hypothetical protein
MKSSSTVYITASTLHLTWDCLFGFEWSSRLSACCAIDYDCADKGANGDSSSLVSAARAPVVYCPKPQPKHK